MMAGMDEALELRRQHQEHDRNREDEGDVELSAALQVLTRFTVERERGALRQLLAHGVLEPLHRLAHRVAVGQAGGDLDAADTVEAVERGRTGDLVQGDEVRQRDELTRTVRAHLDVGEVGCRRAFVRTALQDDVVLATAIDIRRHDARAEHRLERAADGLQRDAEVGRAIAIHGDADLRLALLVVRVDVGQAGVLRGQIHQLLRPVGKLLVVGATQQRQHRLAEAARRDRRARTC